MWPSPRKWAVYYLGFLPVWPKLVKERHRVNVGIAVSYVLYDYVCACWLCSNSIPQATGGQHVTGVLSLIGFPSYLLHCTAGSLMEILVHCSNIIPKFQTKLKVAVLVHDTSFPFRFSFNMLIVHLVFTHVTVPQKTSCLLLWVFSFLSHTR